MAKGNAGNSTITNPIAFSPTNPLAAGTYIVGTAPADYPSLLSAIADLRLRGITGPVVLALKNGDYAGPHLIDSVFGLNGQSTLTIRSLNGNPNQVRIVTNGSSANLLLSGIKGVIIKQLGFIGFGSGSANSRLELNNVDSSIVDSCIFFNTNQQPANIGFGSVLINGGNQLQISNNDFRSGKYQIQVNTTIAPRLSTTKLVIRNNLFLNPIECVTLIHNTDSIVFNKNRITIDSSLISNNSSAPLVIVNSGIKVYVEQNSFYSMAPRKSMSRISSSGNLETKVVNNSVSCRLEQSFPVFEFLVNNPLQGIVDLNHNSISVNYVSGITARQPITFGGSQQSVRYLIRNNAFKLAGAFHQSAIYRFQSTAHLDSAFLSNNLYESQGPNVADTAVHSGQPLTLAQLQVQGKEQNSRLSQAGFASFTDLRPINLNLVNRGLQGTGVLVDLNNIVRDSLPDIGAFEYPVFGGPEVRANGLLDTDSLKSRSFTATIDAIGTLSTNLLYYRKQGDTAWITNPGVALGGNLYAYTIDYARFPSAYQMNDTIYYYIVATGTNGVGSWPLGNTPSNFSAAAHYKHKDILTGQVRIGSCANAHYTLAQLPAILNTLMLADTAYLYFCDPVINLSTPLAIYVSKVQDTLASLYLRPADNITVEFRSSNANIAKLISLDGPRNIHLEGDGRIRMVSTQANIQQLAIGEGVGTAASHISVRGVIFRHTSSISDNTSVAVSCAGNNRVSNLLIEDNDIFGHRIGIRMSANFSLVDNITIRKNFIGSQQGLSGAWYRGIAIYGCRAVVVERNTLKNLISASSVGLAAIDVEGNAVGETVIRDNTVDNIREMGLYAVIGIRLYFGAALVHGNYVRDLYAARGSVTGIFAESSNLQIRHVGIFNNTILLRDTLTGSPGSRVLSTAIMFTGGSTESFIHNNVFGNFTKSTKTPDSTLSSFYQYTSGYSPPDPIRWNINNNVYLTDSSTNANVMITTAGSINRIFSLSAWQQFNRIAAAERDENSRFDTVSSLPFDLLTGIPNTTLAQITSRNSRTGPFLQYSAKDILENPRPATGADIGAHHLGVTSAIDLAPPVVDSSWVNGSLWPCQSGPITFFVRFRDKSGTDSVFLNQQNNNQSPLLTPMTRLATVGEFSTWSTTLNLVLSGGKLVTQFYAKDVHGIVSSVFAGPVVDLNGAFLQLRSDTTIGLGDSLRLIPRINLKNSLVISEITNVVVDNGSVYPSFPAGANRGAFKISNLSSDTLSLAGMRLEFYANELLVTTFTFPPAARILPQGWVWVMLSNHASLTLPEGYFHHFYATYFFTHAWYRLGLVLKDPNNQLLDVMGFQGTSPANVFPASAQISPEAWSGNIVLPGGVNGLRLKAGDINHANGWSPHNLFYAANLLGNAPELLPQEYAPVQWTSNPVYSGSFNPFVPVSPVTYTLVAAKQGSQCTLQDTVVIQVSGSGTADISPPALSLPVFSPGFNDPCFNGAKSVFVTAVDHISGSGVQSVRLIVKDVFGRTSSFGGTRISGNSYNGQYRITLAVFTGKSALAVVATDSSGNRSDTLHLGSFNPFALDIDAGTWQAVQLGDSVRLGSHYSMASYRGLEITELVYNYNAAGGTQNNLPAGFPALSATTDVIEISNLRKDTLYASGLRLNIVVGSSSYAKNLPDFLLLPGKTLHIFTQAGLDRPDLNWYFMGLSTDLIQANTTAGAIMLSDYSRADSLLAVLPLNGYTFNQALNAPWTGPGLTTTGVQSGYSRSVLAPNQASAWVTSNSLGGTQLNAAPAGLRFPAPISWRNSTGSVVGSGDSVTVLLSQNGFMYVEINDLGCIKRDSVAVIVQGAQPGPDLAVLTIIQPAPGSVLSPLGDSIRFRIGNQGNLPAGIFTVRARLNGALLQSAQMSHLLLAGQGMDVMLDSLVVPRQSGPQQICVIVDQLNDPLRSNDSICFNYSSNVSQQEVNKPLSQVKIYPNPAHDLVWVKSYNQPMTGLEIYDLQGKLLQQEQFYVAVTEHQMPLSALPAGLYLVIVKHAGGLSRELLLIDRHARW